MAGNLELPVVDISSSDRASTAKSIRKACLDYGFFYLINHGIEENLINRVFDGSRKFFSLPLHEKMRLEFNETYRGYSPLFAEKLDLSIEQRGDLKETFHIGPTDNNKSQCSENQWPSQEFLPFWRETMESYHEKVMAVGRTLITLIALALNLDENFFEKVGGIHEPVASVRLSHYPGNLGTSGNGIYGASAHTDYGMITLLVTDGVPGLQICPEKEKLPQVWEDVPHVEKAFIVNVGDLLERWTNCLFRSTLHRVLATGHERYSVAFFLEPNHDCLVECLESCCSETCPPRLLSPKRKGVAIVAGSVLTNLAS